MAIDLHHLSQANPAGFRDIFPARASSALEGLRVIDVREVPEFDGPLGHIDGAELVPLGTVVDAAAGWDRSQPLLLVCRMGGRSARAASDLARLGFKNLYNLAGGMTGWNEAGLPVRRG